MPHSSHFRHYAAPGAWAVQKGAGDVEVTLTIPVIWQMRNHHGAAILCGTWASRARRVAVRYIVSIGTSMTSILVVEDNSLIATIVRLGLEQGGYAVRVVDDGRAVLRAAQEYHPDLILLDVLLPGANGFDVLKQLKAHPATTTVPVFMVTGQSDGSSILHGLDSGADAYLSKPIDMPDLLARIAELVARPRAHV